MEMNLQEIAVIVLNYKNYSMTIECVDRIKESGALIVVVDNCSPNDSYDVLDDYYKNSKYVSVIKSDRNGGYAYGNNFGMKWAKKKFPQLKYVSIMNPDVSINSEILEKLALFLFKHKDVMVVAPLVIESDELTRDSIGWNVWNKREVIKSAGYFGAKQCQKQTGGKAIVDGMDMVHYVDAVKGCFYMVKYDEFEKMEYLDEDTFLYGEEEILASKVKKINKKEAVLMSCVCYHNHVHSAEKTTILAIQKKLKNTYQSRRVLLQKYMNATSIEVLLYDIKVVCHIYLVIPFVQGIKKLLRCFDER